MREFNVRGGVNMENKPLYTHVPRWMTTVVESKICEKCRIPFLKTGICAIGIRNFGKDDNTTFYVEHQCSRCSTRVITSFGAQKTGSTEELCYLLIEQMQAQRKVWKSQQLEKGGEQGIIKDKEVKELLDFINHSISHDDFLKFIGSKDISKDDKS